MLCVQEDAESALELAGDDLKHNKEQVDKLRNENNALKVLNLSRPKYTLQHDITPQNSSYIYWYK